MPQAAAIDRVIDRLGETIDAELDRLGECRDAGELESFTKAMGAVARTLHNLRGLLADLTKDADASDGSEPSDVDFRAELARRIEALALEGGDLGVSSNAIEPGG